MANVIFPKWKEARLQGTANASLDGSGTTGVYAIIVDTATYTYNAAHEFYSSLSGLAGTTEQEITTKTYANGLFDGANVTLPSVTAGPTCEAVVLFIKNAGANTTWRLFAYFDTGVTGLPVTPDGNNIVITWNAGGIVQL